MTDFQRGQEDALVRLSEVCAKEINRGFFRNRAIESVLEEIIKIRNEIIQKLEKN